MSLPTADELIYHFKLQRHPEGGFYSQSHRSEGVLPASALPSGISGPRLWSTGIYFLLSHGEKSKLHKIAFDEVWNFYLGDPLIVVEITAQGHVKETLLGRDFKQGQNLQYVVKGGTWFGSYLPNGSEYAFVGCTVAPGFDFADFEMGDRKKLLGLFPGLKSTVELLT